MCLCLFFLPDCNAVPFFCTSSAGGWILPHLATTSYSFVSLAPLVFSFHQAFQILFVQIHLSCFHDICRCWFPCLEYSFLPPVPGNLYEAKDWGETLLNKVTPWWEGENVTFGEDCRWWSAGVQRTNVALCLCLRISVSAEVEIWGIFVSSWNRTVYWKEDSV